MKIIKIEEEFVYKPPKANPTDPVTPNEPVI